MHRLVELGEHGSFATACRGRWPASEETIIAERITSGCEACDREHAASTETLRERITELEADRDFWRGMARDLYRILGDKAPTATHERMVRVSLGEK